MTRVSKSFTSPQAAAIIIGSLFVAVFVVALFLANQRGSQRVAVQENAQEATADQLDKLRQQVADLNAENKVLKADAERAKTQANTSVDQLVQAGEQPIIAAPDVVTVGTVPVTTTTTPPAVIVIPPPTTTTTAPPEPEPTTTTTTTTTAPPPTTTTTTEPPATTTTTTVAEETTTTLEEPAP